MTLKTRKTELLIFLSVFIVYSFFTLLKIANNLPLEGLTTDYYFQIAENLSKSFSFSLDGINPTALRMPGYPLFLAVIFSIFKNWWAVLFIQHAIAGISAVLLYLISRKWLNQSWSIAVSLIWAFELYAIDISSQFFTEPIYILFLLIIVCIFIKYTGEIKNTKYFILIAALLLATLTYIRPTSLLLPMIFAPTIIYANSKTENLNFLNSMFSKKTLIQLSMIFSIYVILLLPWSFRNYITFNSWQISSDNASSIYITASQFKAEQKGFKNTPTEIPKESGLPKFKESGHLDKTSAAIKKSTKIILSKPLGFTAFYFKHLLTDTVGSSWWGSIRNLIKGTSGQVNYHKEVKNAILELNIKKISNFHSKEIIAALIMIFGTIFWIVTLLLSVLGAIILFKKSDTNTRSYIILIASIILYLLLIGNMAAGDMIRYRFSASPFIIMFAISGLLDLTKKTKI
ncbi:MAG: glycosyltransferase family 39 protein [Parcubacteria group bacterium]|nr:glycosyltransferase family 39 protein [Parcubacteria group bacterium]MCR4342519.1 glycosyltransferase family 39 protein [Patescibacteria group bacterium]